MNFLPEFLARVNLSEKNKRLENSISRTYLLSLKKDLANFQLTVQKAKKKKKKKKKREKTIQEYVRLLKLTKTKYQKPFEENKILKEKIATTGKERQIKKEKIIENRL